MKVDRRNGTKQVVGLLLIVLCVGMAVAGCAKKKPTQADVISQAPPRQSEPTVIELSDSKLKDAMKEGEIGEEDRDQLAFLPKRPPTGTEFVSTAELRPIYFEFDKYSLTTQARETLARNAVWLKSHPDVAVRIEGHCDERGTLEYNEVLGENRAMSTQKYLIQLGIDPGRIYTISYGETMPVDPAHTEAAWAKNRRAEFKIAK